jgi:Ca2+-binding EF-hand superfamily protein
MQICKDPERCNELWDMLDFHGNNIVSLSKIDRLMVQRYPLLDHKPALLRAYKQTCLRDGGDGDAWVEPKEFPMLLANLFYFNKLFQCFEMVDTDDDRRVDQNEFIESLSRLSLVLSEAEAKAAFDEIDSSKGGIVLFDAFCVWYTKKVNPTREIADCTAQFVHKRTKDSLNGKTKTGLRDAMPDYESKTFDKLEKELIATAKDPAKLAKLWDAMDFNDNQIVSLAEIDKLMVQSYPLLNHKPALMRAYKQTCLREGGDGDAWVEPKEFPQLLVNLFYFNKLFQCFEQVDTDNDRRVDEKEFISSLKRLGMSLSDREAKVEFDAMDSNDGGVVLFDEFCQWYTTKVSPGREIVDSTSQFVDEVRGKKLIKF